MMRTVATLLLILAVSSSEVSASDLFEIGSPETVAGGGTGTGGSARAASILPLGVAAGPAGATYIADEQFNLIRSVSNLDILETIAGNGSYGFNGEGLSALESSVSVPAGLDVDTSGRLHFVDLGNHSVRRIELDGRLVTLVGEDHPVIAQRPHRFSPASIGISQTGALYVADRGNNMIWQIDPAGEVAAFAGDGERGFSGDGGPATDAKLADPRDVCVGTDGTVYIADFGNGRVRKVGLDGIITTEVGSGQELRWENIILAWHASIRPSAVAMDVSGELLIADVLLPRILRLRADGMVLTEVTLPDNAEPAALAVETGGGILVADYTRRRVYRWQNSALETVAGNGRIRAAGDGGDALNASLFEPVSIAVDAKGQLYVADRQNHMVRVKRADGTIEAVAGTGVPGSGGDGGPAANAQLYRPSGLAFDSQGRLHIADEGNHRVRRLDADGRIESVAGTGLPGYAGDGGPGLEAALNQPTGLVFDDADRLYIADAGNGRIRRLDADGWVRTVAGNGSTFPLDAGGPALGTALLRPVEVKIDRRGRLLIADGEANRIFRMGEDGFLSVVAGNGSRGAAQDGSLADAAELGRPLGFAPDGSGGVFISDTENHRLLHADREGILRVLASGFVRPASLFLDADGALLVAEAGRNEIKRIRVDRLVEPARERVTVPQGYAVRTLAALPVPKLLEVVYHPDEARIYITHARGIEWMQDGGRRHEFAEFLVPRYSSTSASSGLIVGAASFIDWTQPLTNIRPDGELNPLYQPVPLSFAGADAITRGQGGNLGTDLFVHHVRGEVTRVAEDEIAAWIFARIEPGTAKIQATPGGSLYAVLSRSRSLWRLTDEDGDGEILGLEARAVARFESEPMALAYENGLFAATANGRIYQIAESGEMSLFAAGFAENVLDISPAPNGGLLVLEGNARGGRLLLLSPPQPAVASWPSQVDFGRVQLGNPITASLILRNDGDRGVELTLLPGPGVRIDSERLALAAGEHRSVTAELAPWVKGVNTSYVEFSDAEGQVLLSVPLLAEGIAPLLRVTPHVEFGTVLLGSSARRSLVLHNDGEAGLFVRLQLENDHGFRTAAAEYPEIPPGSSLTVDISWSPEQRRAHTSQLLISSNDPDHPIQTVELNGFGGIPQIAGLPESIQLGAVKVGDTERQKLELQNEGEVDLWITQILTGERELRVSPSHLQIPPGETRSVELTYRPQAHGALAGELFLGTNDPKHREVHVDYAGRGLSSFLALPAGPLLFAATALGQVSELSFGISNESSATIAIRYVRTNSTQYRVTGFPSRLKPGVGGSVDVEFRPLRLGDVSGELTLTTEGPATESLRINLQGRSHPGSQLSLEWQGQSVAPGSEFEVVMTLANAYRLVGMVIELALPLDQVEFLGVRWPPNGLFADEGTPLVIHQQSGPDRLEFGFSQPGVSAPRGVSGGGELGRLRFRLRPGASGEIEIRVPRAVYRSSQGRADDLAQDARVSVPVMFAGDFDADGRVDFDDFLMLMDNLGTDSLPGIQIYDLNGDGQVSLDDVFVLFADMEPAAKSLAREQLPLSFGLNVYPNPFNAQLVLEYQLPREQQIRLVIFNTLGQRVRHLESGWRQRGIHQVIWDGRDGSGREVTSGLYIATLRGTRERISRRLLLVR